MNGQYEGETPDLTENPGEEVREQSLQEVGDEVPASPDYPDGKEIMRFLSGMV